MATSLAELEATVTADTSDFDSKMSDAGQKIDDLGTKASNSSANFGAASAAMATGAAGIAAGFTSAIGTAADFEAALSGIASVGGADAVAAMDEIRAKALELGAETSFSASEAAAAMEELVKAGVPVQDVLAGGADAALNLAAATGVATDAAAGYIAQGLNVYNETLSASYDTVAERAEHVANVIAQSANASATDVGQLGLAFSAVGPVAAMFGLTIDDTATALAILAQNGLQGSDAGTSLKSMFLSLTHASKPTQEALADIGLTLEDFYDSAGNFIGIEASFDKLRTSMEAAGYTSEQVNATLAQIFGTDAVRAASVFFKTNEDGWDGMRAGMENAGTVQEQAAIRLDNLQGSMEALSGSVETVAIVFGSALIPAIRPIVEGLTELVNVFMGLPEPVQTAIAGVLAIAGAFLGVASAVAFVMGPLVAMAPTFTAIGIAVSAAAGPFLLVVAALAALYLAYQTNFLGFADGVNAAAALVQAGLGNLVLLAQNVAAAFGEGGLSAALGVLASAFQTAWSTISTAIASIDWSAVSAAVQTGLQLASDAITTWLGEQATALQGAFNDVDWGAVGATLLNGLMTAIAAVGAFNELLLTKGGELIQGLLTGITQKWPEVDGWLKNLATDIGATVGELSQTLLAKGADLMAGLLTGITDRWPDVDSWLGNLATDASETVGSLLETLTQQGGDLISGLWTAAQAKWDEAAAWLGTISSLVTASTLTDAVTLLTQQGSDVIQGLWTAAQSKWEEATAWLASLSSLVTASTLTDALTLLTQQGTDLISGLLTAAQAKWTEAVTWLQGLAAAATAAVGDLSAALYQAGVDLIGGLVSGILSQAGAIADAIASVIPSDIGIDIGGISVSNPFTNPFDSGGGGGGGGGQGGSSGGSSAKPATGSGGNRRAAGGPVWSGREYLVGEEGPELFVPRTSGTIVPNGGSLAPAFAGGGGPQIGTYIANVTLRDERDMQTYVRQQQRSQRVMSGRGS